MIRPTVPSALHRSLGSLLGCVLAAGSLALPLATPPAHAQAAEPERALATPGSPFNITAVQSLLARGDAAAAAGNLTEARRLYDQARDASRKLLSFYRDLSGAFRGLDARIPREMDEKGRQTLDLLVGANMRLAALFRRQGQPEVAVPLLVEVVKTMTPANESGRKAYQQLLEIGFVSTPYTAPGAGS
ncbi:MAG: hypothetical protein ACKO22_10720 [Cyanobium sp.]